MRIDEFNTVVREKDGYPGDIGDSCADTARLFVLDPLTLFYDHLLNLDVFWTPRGYVRHPLAPERDEKGESWREEDFSSDQALPLLLAYEVSRNILRTNLANRLRIAGWRTGDGNLVSPGLYALSKFVLSRDRVWLHVLGLINLVQALLFLVHVRWSDDERHTGWRRIQWGGNEGDYLNWHVINDFLWLTGVYWPLAICYRIWTPRTVYAKVKAYYASQPNHEWYLAPWRQSLNAISYRLVKKYTCF